MTHNSGIKVISGPSRPGTSPLASAPGPLGRRFIFKVGLAFSSGCFMLVILTSGYSWKSIFHNTLDTKFDIKSNMPSVFGFPKCRIELMNPKFFPN